MTEHDEAVALIADKLGATVVEERTSAEVVDELPLPGVLSETSYRLPDELSYERWASIGQTLHRIAGSVLFWLGDWWLAGERAYGEAAAQAAPTGYASETLRKAAWVCERIPPEERRPELTFTHHALAASLEPVARTTVLAQASAEGWTTRELAHEVRQLRRGVDGDEHDHEGVDDGMCPCCGQSMPNATRPPPRDGLSDRTNPSSPKEESSSRS